MNLTADEIKLIESIRRIMAEKEAKKKVKKKVMLHLLETTTCYFEWLINNKIESSFSTFIDEYGYGGDFCGWVPNVFYKRIIDLIEVADQWVLER